MQKATLLAGIRLMPGDPRFLEELGVQLEAEEAWQELHDLFVPQLRSVEAGSQLDGYLRYMLGKAAMELGQPGEAHQWLRRATEIQPDFPFAHHLLARCYRNVHRLEDALQASLKCCDLAPDFPWAWLDTGELQLLLNQPHQALHSLQKGLRAQKNRDPKALKLFEDAFSRAHQAATAIERSALAAELWPERPPPVAGQPLDPIDELELSLHQFRTLLDRVEARRDAGVADSSGANQFGTKLSSS
ncbi:tetratricopeptide repeat protein [Cyanobium sp. FGCU-6]|nr:tetratricopeptide repeat protein [Cyanobium sp. FGCU6]